MRELEECLRLTRRINEIREQIEELKSFAMNPRNQIISDMPKGGGSTTNAVERYIIRREKLEYELEQLIEKRFDLWEKITDTLDEMNQRIETKMMLQLRFCNGYSWKKCVLILENLYPDEKWSTNKCFRIYRSVLHKISTNNL